VKYNYSGLVLATLLAGGFLVIFAFSRVGSYIKFIPYPVVLGFTAGIAVILFSTEFKDLLGLTMGDLPADFHRKIVIYGKAIHSVNWWAALFGSLTIGVIVFIRVLRLKRMPAHVIAVAIVTLLSVLTGVPIETIGSKFGEIGNVFAMPEAPEISLELVKMIFPSALAIAMLAAIESLLSAVVADGMTTDRHDSDTELFAQGVGNIASALLGGIPATGAIARTVTNIKAGAKTPIAGLIHAVMVMLFVLFFSNVIEAIPMTVIAGMLTVIAWDMLDLRRLTGFCRQSRSDVFVMAAVFLITILVDITVAVEVGVLLAALMFMKRMSDVTTVDIVKQPTANPDDLVGKELPKGVTIYEINGPFFFGAANNLIHTMEQVADVTGIIILRMRSVPVMDTTGLHALETFVATCGRNGATLILSGVKSQPYKLIKSSGLEAKLGEKNVTSHIDKALARANELVNIIEARTER
jgi:SulP family sulfate permease